MHVGTHKTGTTAIQRFFAANDEWLTGAGIYYPRRGRWTHSTPGHHNVAFELTDDPRFDAAAGTLHDVIAEIATVAPMRACLSSEQFGYLHESQGALVALRDAIAAIGYRPRIIVYVRAQDEYAESLYAESVKHDETLPFSRYLDDVIREGAIIRPRSELRARRVSRFDYVDLVEPFAQAFGSDAVAVRGYRDAGRADSLVHDFLDAVEMAGRLPSGLVAEGATYDNRRLTTGRVITSLFMNTEALEVGSMLSALGRELVARDEDAASQPFAPLGPSERARIAQRFAASNARLVRDWNVAPGTFEPHGGAGSDSEPARRARSLFALAEAVRVQRMLPRGA